PGQRHVVHVPGSRFHVGRRINAGKGAEIVDEVRLIEISSIQSNVCPDNRLAGRDTAQYSLKAPHPAEELGCESDLSPEQFDKASRTEPGSRGDIGNGLAAAARKLP